MYELNKKESKTLNSIAETYYMKPALDMINSIISNSSDKKK